ncbi:hypothetical protein PBI_JOHANN_36 [Microbacterium phage Johann]|uniref:Uncharacterized protein n=2 Tax=Goodmanvirus goodman TaxID=2734238 RepID=A0A3G3LZX2_9CAUD|nr:hypothetical protein HOU56_gp36 [Microbacterium phage Goodman]AYQ99492.1 hypothetical protein PBI_GOODMAN_36 [Microbacterium phage Goodman]AYQ99660.1 hypothetical protein PBI_JOHANN_36 [Microbacterium phage Johann]
MSTVTIKTIKPGKACGFCTTGNRHDLCPGGILNGNLTEVVLCGCTDHGVITRCLDCGVRSLDEVDPQTWQCIDQEACTARRAKAREKSLVALYGSSETGEPLRSVPAKEKPAKAPSKPKIGKCLCCGETTGGGLFRPGHDSKYLTRAVTRINDGATTLDAMIDLWADQGISEALQGKLRKRVAA